MINAYEYKIVSGDTRQVEREVKELSGYGWQLHGSPLFMGTGGLSGQGHFAQAMIKEYEQPGAWS